ncbi:MAG: peptidase C14 caspase catalytic subunit [Planctomycetota bacterium]|nr:MAG: peptidase C14 caspase catalytic subunit [Planctomycetota bacterium]
MEEEVASGRAQLPDELIWAAEEWLDGRASDRELAEFLSEAWRVNGACPPFSDVVVNASWRVRPFARLFDAWAKFESLEAWQRLLVVTALGYSGDATFAPALVAYLDTNDAYLKYAALDGLANIGSPEVAKSVIPLLHDPSTRIRKQAIATLASMDAREAVEAIRECLKDEDEGVVAWAIDVLAAWRDESVFPFLEARLEDGDQGTALAFARLGKRIPEKHRLEMFWLLDDDSPEFLWSVFGDRLADGDRKVLVDGLGKDGLREQLRAQRTLGALLETKEALHLLEDQPAAIRRTAALALKRLPRDEQIGVLRTLLGDDDREVRIIAAAGLSALGDRDSAPGIAKMLTSRDDRVAIEAGYSLSILGAIEQAPHIALGLDRTGYRASTAMYVSWHLDAREFEPAIRERAAAGDGTARWLLTLWSGEGDADWLASLLEADHELVQQMACDRLIRLGELDRAWEWILAHRDDGTEREGMLVALLESGQPGAAEFVMTLPKGCMRSQRYLPIHQTWPRVISRASPSAFAKMPKHLRATIVRRLRNFAAMPFVDVQMLARVSLARLGELSDAQARLLLDAASVKEKGDAYRPKPSRYLDEVFVSLNAAREPDGWERVHRTIETARQVVTEADFAEAVSKAGLVLDPGDARLRFRTAPGVVTSLARMLERQMPYSHVWVLEGRKLRLIQRDAAAEYWRKRLGGK